MAILTVYTIMLFALFGNSLFLFGIPGYFSVVTEGLILLLLVAAYIPRLVRDGYVLHLWYSFLFMVMISACSIVVNGSDSVRAIFSLRLIFRFYFFYLGLTTLGLDDNDMRKMNMFVAVLLLLQLPVVAIKFCMYGISERTGGAYAIHEGSMTTMLPIVIIFYLAAYYFLYRPKLGYILVGIGFVLFSIVGKKRAVFFLYPLQFLAIYYYIYVKGKGARFSRKVGLLFLGSISILIVSGTILYFNDTMNPESKVGGSIDLGYALDYARKYTTGEDGYGYSYGRIATTIRISEVLWNSGLAVLFFGFGPCSTTPSLFDSQEDRENVQALFDKLKVGYGQTSMSKIALEYGVLGVVTFSLIVFLFARMCWTYYKYQNDPYWKAFAAGSVGFAFSMLFFFFAYHSTAFWGDTMPALYFYAMSVVYTRLKRARVHTVETESLT